LLLSGPTQTYKRRHHCYPQNLAEALCGFAVEQGASWEALMQIAEADKSLPPSHCWIALSFLGRLHYLFRKL